MPQPEPPGGWKDFWKTPMEPGERAKWLRDTRFDINTAVEAMKEKEYEERHAAWERERYNL